jgi:hypothetical protein
MDNHSNFLLRFNVSLDPDSLAELEKEVRAVFVPSRYYNSEAGPETVLLLVKLDQPLCLSMADCNEANAAETVPQFLDFVKSCILALGEPVDCLVGKLPNIYLPSVLEGRFPGPDAQEIAEAQLLCNGSCVCRSELALDN